MKKLFLSPLKYALLLPLTLSMNSCSENSGKTNNTDNILSNELQSFQENVLQELSKNDRVKSIYTGNDLLWIGDSLSPNKNGRKLISILNNAQAYGLSPDRYNAEQCNTLDSTLTTKSLTDRVFDAAELEALLSVSFQTFGKHLQSGIIDTTSYKYEFLSAKKTIDPFTILNDKNQDNIAQLLDLQPQSPEYKDLQKGLELFLQSHKINDTLIEVPIFKGDSIAAYKKAKEALVIHSYLKDTTVNRDSTLAALVAFQIEHGLTPDSLIGKNTANALSENPYTNYLKAAATLQKLRWENTWTEPYILANIPGFTIRIRNKSEIILENRVVVGVLGKETPEIESHLQYLVVYPFWNVPYSIKTEEIIPKLKKDSTYLQRNGYELMSGSKVVSFSSLSKDAINSGNIPYSIRQKGGNSNALGLIKFIFPNKHSVYFHDTPSKSYFYNDLRAYSHGCVRVQQPLSLAERILELDNNKYNIDSVETFIKRKERKTITIQSNIGVHIRYFTALANKKGIVFFTDVYQRDKELIRILNNLFAKTSPVQ